MSVSTLRRALLMGLTGFVLVNGVLVSSTAWAGPQCVDLFKIRTAWDIVRDDVHQAEKQLDFFNDLDYMRAYKEGSDGIVDSRFERRFKTRLYYAATGVPGRDGKVPLVDPNAKAIYIFFHGSGTMKASGRVFKRLMNTLGQMGYGAVSFDMPYHMDGPRDHKFDNPEYFMSWVHTIVEEIKRQAPGKPVYLTGHSFGPTVIAEYLARYPFSAKGAALLSPAGYNPELQKWIFKYTSKMNLGPDVVPNPEGGSWAFKVSENFRWKRTDGKFDPTVANPDLVVRVLSGDREEYLPAPLGANGKPNGPIYYDIEGSIHRHFKNAQVTVEKNIGHYIFDFQDGEGRNALMRELLALDGVDAQPKNIQRLITENEQRFRSQADQLWFLYATDPMFKSWIDSQYGVRTLRIVVENQDARMMKKIATEFEEAKEVREKHLRELAVAYARKDPEFLARFRGTLEAMDPTLRADGGVGAKKKTADKKNDSGILSGFIEYLDSKGITIEQLES